MQNTQEPHSQSPRTSLSEDKSEQQTLLQANQGLVLWVAQVLQDCCTGVCNSSVVFIVTMNFKVHRTSVLTLLALPSA